ncbi:Ldh family oxidoreductase [Oscillochloris sp. ZM17-4]|uniref:Ldh family oxidoreductase n=1 Tax=Oscillochloris sp. ZM17-4 TaxID=2866714 RepID=UPI001C733659|nr:Ldh family oxidoreductase [Oscillochloris sp. ZM17-4]MBX0327735.1 Ldh family oxidoreductase [Oscillochloris sp. ZM17-4]
MTDGMRFAADELARLATDLLAALGVPADDAATAAAAVVQADLDGVDTHGMGRLPNYLLRLRRGIMNPAPQMAFVRRMGATAVLDADNGMGQVAAARAMREAVRLAGELGIGLVTVRGSGHFGATSYYTGIAIDAGMIGLALSNSPPAMAPHGGRAAFLGTNPIGVGVPVAGGDPIILDMATSAIARGQILKANRNGAPIPPGVAVDEAGATTTDAAAALRGALLPMAGAKGFGLALAVEVLCALLAGAAASPEIPSYFDNFERPSTIGHVMAAINIAAFVEPDAFAARAAGLIDGLHQVPPAIGSAGVRIPGERRSALRRQLLAGGVPLAPAAVAQLTQLAEELGVAPPSPIT